MYGPILGHAPTLPNTIGSLFSRSPTWAQKSALVPFLAIAFGKRHKNVLQTIDKMMRSGHHEIATHARLNFQPSIYTVPAQGYRLKLQLVGYIEIATHARLNFEPISFVDSMNRHKPMFRMTAKGLSELAMSFSGDKLRVVRIRFLSALEQVGHYLTLIPFSAAFVRR